MPGVRPLVIAYHLVWTGYGWWLPNDPRGSSSPLIRQDVLAELGQLHPGRKSVQPTNCEIREFHRRAGERLYFKQMQFSPHEWELIAAALAEVIREERYTCYACAVMPDHVHFLVRKHKHSAEEMIENFQSASRMRLRREGRWGVSHPVWGGLGWKVFLDHPRAIRRTIEYVEQNPVKWGLPQQSWGFVAEYDGWPLHAGHSPNSPYARRLRAAGRYP